LRVVVDTNVLVSGLLNPYGNPSRVVDAVLSRVVTVLFDDRILGEYREVLARPKFGFQPVQAGALLDFIEFAGELTVARHLPLVLADSSDLPFLEVAVAGQAEFLITGNVRHFVPRRGQHDVAVYRPADFVQRLKLGKSVGD